MKSYPNPGYIKLFKYLPYLDQLQDRYSQIYGPIFKDNLGSVQNLHLCDPDMMEEVYRAQGKYPDRPPIEAWKEWRLHNGHKLGLLTGYVWNKMKIPCIYYGKK